MDIPFVRKVDLKKLENSLFFLVILFLPTQLGKHFWPHFSFVFSLRIDYLSPAIYLWDLLTVGLITIWIWQMVFSYFKEGTKIQLNNKFLFLLLFFLLTQAMSVLPAENPLGSLVRLKEYLITGMFGLYLSSRKFTEIKPQLFPALILAVIFTCLLATTQFLLGHSLGLWILGERDFSITTPLIAKFDFYEHVFLRPYATFSHPNMLAGFLILALPMVLYGLPKKLKSLKMITGLYIIGTAFITFSRPGLVLVSIQSVILFRRFWKLLLIFGVIITPLIVVRLVSVFTFDTLAVLRRQELSDYALKVLTENPLAGIGLNNFINVLAADQVLVGTSRFLQPVHNIFLLVAAETGLLGLFGFLLLLVTAIWQNLRKRDEFSKVLFGNLMMIVFLGLFDHYFLSLPQGQRILFLIMGLSFRRD